MEELPLDLQMRAGCEPETRSISQNYELDTFGDINSLTTEQRSQQINNATAES